MTEISCKNLAMTSARRYRCVRGSPPMFGLIVTQLVTRALTACHVIKAQVGERSGPRQGEYARR
jgi:hypothetical protein